MTVCARGLVLVSLVLALCGCSGSDKPQPTLTDRCLKVCEAAQAAECTDPPPPSDCAAACNGVTTSVEATGCANAYRAALDCADAHEACDIEACATENDAVLYCVQCSPNDDDAGSEDAGSDEDAGSACGN